MSDNIWEKQASMLRADLKVLQSFIDDLDDSKASKAFYNVRGSVIAYLHSGTPAEQPAPADDSLNSDEIEALRAALSWMGESTYETLEECGIYQRSLLRRLIHAVVAIRDATFAAQSTQPESAQVSTARLLVNAEDKLHALHAEADELGAALDRDIALYGSGGAPVSTEQAGDAWISVGDRLPEDCTFVAIFDPENDGMPVRTAHWLAGSRTFESEYGWLACDEVSHWMPLPAAPSPNNSPSTEKGDSVK